MLTLAQAAALAVQSSVVLAWPDGCWQACSLVLVHACHALPCFSQSGTADTHVGQQLPAAQDHHYRSAHAFLAQTESSLNLVTHSLSVSGVIALIECWQALAE